MSRVVEQESLVATRIEQAPDCTVIDLSDSEIGIYSGRGWKLARFECGQLVDLFDPLEVLTVDDELASVITNWLKKAEGEIWLVMCLAYWLCEPRRIHGEDALDIAHVLRVFGERGASGSKNCETGDLTQSSGTLSTENVDTYNFRS